MADSALVELLRTLVPDAATTLTDDGAVEVATDPDVEDAVAVRVTDDAVELRLPTVVWVGQTPEATTRLWRRIPLADAGPGTDEIRDAVRRARRARKREWATCRFCGERVPREHRIDADTCHGCASEHLGVVF